MEQPLKIPQGPARFYRHGPVRFQSVQPKNNLLHYLRPGAIFPVLWETPDGELREVLLEDVMRVALNLDMKWSGGGRNRDHTWAITARLAGASHRDIARRLGVSVPRVAQIFGRIMIKAANESAATDFDIRSFSRKPTFRMRVGRAA